MASTRSVDYTPQKYLNVVIPKLISKDVVFVCVVGKGCEAVHDLFDDEIAFGEVNSEHHYLPKHTILTVWKEDYEEGVWLGIHNAHHPKVNIDKIIVMDMTSGNELPRVGKMLPTF